MIADHDVAYGGAAETEDENYFISMTDMMVGILFIFIIMLMVFALNFRQKTDNQESNIEIAKQVAEQIDSLRKEVSAEISVMNKAEQTRRRLLNDIEDRLKAEGLNVQVDETNGILRLTEDAVRFASDRSNLSPDAARNVDAIARVLAATLPAYTACPVGNQTGKCPNESSTNVETVFVEGHTDLTGSDDRNWQLSTERAVNTYRQLISRAPALRELHNTERHEVLSVSGYSSTRPVTGDLTPDAYATNRRIDLRFVMEADDRERLNQVMSLLGQMEGQVGQLLRPSEGGSVSKDPAR